MPERMGGQKRRSTAARGGIRNEEIGMGGPNEADYGGLIASRGQEWSTLRNSISAVMRHTSWPPSECSSDSSASASGSATDLASLSSLWLLLFTAPFGAPPLPAASPAVPKPPLLAAAPPLGFE